jgi:NAD(P)-dependent dehydrogenase (short-subunit alcohol dehydrogenase family)
MNDIFSVNNKVIMVTGGGRGNGKAIVEGFLERGALVCSIDMNFEEMHEKSGNFHAIEFDLRKLTEIPELVKIIYSKYGTIDVLVNNAGVSLSSDNPYAEEILDNTLIVNLKAAYILSSNAGLLMSKNNAGSIINVTSLGAELGFPDNPSYQVSKAALKQLTRALAIDFGKNGIRVNNICPGYILTSMTQKSYENKILREERSKRMILDRWGTSNDLVGVCIFLASNASSYVTGTDIYVDGGWTAKGL